ncbi:MAG: nitrile hydratase subunit beta [Gammaproteobacteria bacterium]|nr:nitrile hydratase subunit beta [Gammaproteobacteria bacterium]
MDGIHDLGGKHGYGRVERGENEPVFHERWEAAVFAMSAVGPPAGAWNNIDRFRHGIERIDPVAYLSHGYYGRWLGGIETLLVEAGVLSTDEITTRALERGATVRDRIAARPSPAPEPLADVAPGNERTLDWPPRFAVDDVVMTSVAVKAGHTRLPAYARGRLGRIHALHDGWVYPDTNAHGQGEQQQYLYTVEFTGDELWGEDADPALRVYLDLFEPYLSRVAE